MAYLSAVSSLDNVIQYEIDDPTQTIGGPGGGANAQAQALLNRTKYIYDNFFNRLTQTLDNIADGTAYARVQKAKANAINSGNDLGITRYTLVPFYKPLANSTTGLKYLGSGIILAGTNSTAKIIRSTDYGRSWTDVLSPSGYAYSFAQNGANIIAAINSSFGYYLSTDNGATWGSKIIPTGATGTYTSGVWYINGRWFITDGSSPRKLFYSDVAAPASSTDWTEITTITDCMALAYFNTKLYAVKSGNGIYVSTDNGLTWAQALSGSFANLMIAGSYLVAIGASVYRTTDGNTWVNANSNISLSAALHVVTLNNTIFARQNYRNIYFSVDYGTTWNNVGYELPISLTSYGYTLETIGTMGVLAASNGGIYQIVEVGR